MTVSNITRFRELVFSDYALTLQLYQIADHAEFIATVTDIASTHGILLSELDVASAINAGTRRWVERWI